jgi:cytochrome-b5 reductase
MWTRGRLNKRCGSQPARSPGSGQIRLFMPNHLQLLFLGSFVLTFLFLLTVSNYILSKLHQAGYDISNLILLGLPRADEPTHHPMSATAPSFLDLRQSVVAQIVAILLTVGSSAFIYFKFGRSGTSSCLTSLV